MRQTQEALFQRLNQIGPIVCSSVFRGKSGLGDEIPFYIFDYPPEFELDVREHVKTLVETLSHTPDSPKVLHVNLFTVVLEYLKTKESLSQIFEFERTEGTANLLREFDALLNPDRLCEFFVARYQPQTAELILFDGVGSCWSFLRAHTVLNNIQNYVEDTPIVLFYPGEYTGRDLYPFGLRSLKANYYRAFPLISVEFQQRGLNEH